MPCCFRRISHEEGVPRTVVAPVPRTELIDLAGATTGLDLTAVRDLDALRTALRGAQRLGGWAVDRARGAAGCRAGLTAFGLDPVVWRRRMRWGWRRCSSR
ncbi:hypothetical protein [Streptomyces sp. G44]|uniref:hypothetical protein n=1 Tax=Streptomyces sp. G44 TaxID=2807632 RepID=UPI001EF7B6EA|nr:hypothetical protein [Streptomyces sp. G44]